LQCGRLSPTVAWIMLWTLEEESPGQTKSRRLLASPQRHQCTRIKRRISVVGRTCPTMKDHVNFRKYIS
jgi:hypothetical protein